MNIADFLIGALTAFCVILALPWTLALLLEAYDRIKNRIRGGDVWVVRKIKEKSVYTIYDDKGNMVKTGFKDIQDAYEYAINHVLSTGVAKVVIKGEITITAKR